MTGIEWADFTGNPWMGCTGLEGVQGALSGCQICYAEQFCTTRMGIKWGAGQPRVKAKGFVARFRHLNRVAEATGMPFTVFPGSLCDWLDAEVNINWLIEMVDTMEECRALTWIPLTHRPHLARKRLPTQWLQNLPDHIWPGVTVDHRNHGFRWQQLQEAWPDCCRLWISAEPLSSSLGSLDLSRAASIIVGGASNTKDPAWAFNTNWAREAIDRYGRKVFFKQYGVFRDGEFVGDKKKAGKDLDGHLYDWTPWPLHRSQLTRIAGR